VKDWPVLPERVGTLPATAVDVVRKGPSVDEKRYTMS
jgi:hypothetical protein